MDSCATETEEKKTSFAAAIKKGWERVCDTYLSESGFDRESEEWKFVRALSITDIGLGTFKAHFAATFHIFHVLLPISDFRVRFPTFF